MSNRAKLIASMALALLAVATFVAVSTSQPRTYAQEHHHHPERF